MISTCSLQLSLFGVMQVQVTDDLGGTRPLNLPNQSRQLLAVLGLSRGILRSRANLCSTMVAECGEPLRPGTFNSTLWRLRQALERAPFQPGDLLVSDRQGGVALSLGQQVQVDVEDYLSAVLPPLSRRTEALSPGDLAALQRAVSLYRAEPLEGMNDDWALREREKLRRHQLQALSRLVEHSLRVGDAHGGITHAQAILDIDELREDVHRDLMRLHMMAGQQAMALQQFERCRAALKRELSIVPMRETMALYQELSEQAVGRSGVRSAPAPAPQAAEAPVADKPADVAAMLLAASQHLAAADAQLQRAQSSLRLALCSHPVTANPAL